MSEGDPAAGGFAFVVSVFRAGQWCGDKDEDGKVGGKGVVLLVRGEGKEDQNKCGEDCQ
jgi:hypothetical protein